MTLMRYFLVWLLSLPALPVLATDQSATLDALRDDLSGGSLKPVLARQRIAPLPATLLEQWVADTLFQTFAITGFNDNGKRFAARVRLHFEPVVPDAPGSITFVRMAGSSGTDYQLDAFFDYATGLDLDNLLSQRDWLVSRDGRAFLKTLSQSPHDPALATLAQGRKGVLPLWLAQCSGRDCEAAAMAAQEAGDRWTLWQLQRQIQRGNRPGYEQVFSGLRKALGDDPWLWQLAGLYARAYQQCDWIVAPLQKAWLRHREHRALADSALQCTLSVLTPGETSLGPQGTDFLTRLSHAIGPATLAQAIQAYYQGVASSPPGALNTWLAGQQGGG